MASLTHVCMWHGNSWQAITAEEAAKLHPGELYLPIVVSSCANFVDSM